MENTKSNKMTWRAGRGKHIFSNKGYYFARLPDGTHIEVHPDAYHQAFHAYLLLKWVRPTTWSEIMGKADAEWRAYCHLMNAFAEDIQQWLTFRGEGTFVTHHALEV